MNTKSFFKRVGRGFADLLGFHKNSKYVNAYISDTNIRSSIFMSAVVIILEIWLIIRQTHDEVIPKWQSGATTKNGWLLTYTSVFFLFLLTALSVMVFALTYHRAKTLSPRARLIANCIASGAALGFCIFGFFEPYSNREGVRYVLANVLLVTLYVIAALLTITIIAGSVHTYKTKSKSRAWNITVMILFAAMLFTFGVKVSYSDYTSSNPKQMICFLTMVLYGACLLIWRPYISIIMNTGLFIIFWSLLANATISVPSAYRADVLASEGYTFGAMVKDGDLVNYITFLISLTMVCISIYHQRRNEAIKDEELEYLANYDELTHLYNFQHFVRTLNTMHEREGKIVLFVNISNFKTYNDQRGFDAGNKFLQAAGRVISEVFGEDALCCRQSDDHFLVFADSLDLDKKISDLDQKIGRIDEDISLQVRVGGYRIVFGEDARRASDKARYACTTLANDLTNRYREYDKKMHDEYHLMQHVIHSIDIATKEEWVRPYYQPVVWSEDGTLCGVEALARWIDPKRGFLSPGQFVPTLEATKLVHKLDARILESVCRDIRYCLDNNMPIVPASINFSRLDFELMDVVDVLEGYVKQYNVPKDYLHVEITESALSDDEGLLTKKVQELKSLGYALWLDDFGSGYSSLNVLKDFDFDVMKIDMKFLSGFENNPKARPLVESVIEMAKRLGMRTLTEGVETSQEREFLSSANCERLQGYLFGKAIPLEALQEKIANGELRVSEKLL